MILYVHVLNVVGNCLDSDDRNLVLQKSNLLIQLPTKGNYYASENIFYVTE